MSGHLCGPRSVFGIKWDSPILRLDHTRLFSWCGCRNSRGRPEAHPPSRPRPVSSDVNHLSRRELSSGYRVDLLPLCGRWRVRGGSNGSSCSFISTQDESGVVHKLPAPTSSQSRPNPRLHLPRPGLLLQLEDHPWESESTGAGQDSFGSSALDCEGQSVRPFGSPSPRCDPSVPPGRLTRVDLLGPGQKVHGGRVSVGPGPGTPTPPCFGNLACVEVTLGRPLRDSDVGPTWSQGGGRAGDDTLRLVGRVETRNVFVGPEVPTTLLLLYVMTGKRWWIVPEVFSTNCVSCRNLLSSGLR